MPKTKSQQELSDFAKTVRKSFNIDKQVAKDMIRYTMGLNDMHTRAELAPLFRRAKRNASFRAQDKNTWHLLKAASVQDLRDIKSLVATPTAPAGYGNESWSGKGNAPSRA